MRRSALTIFLGLICASTALADGWLRDKADRFGPAGTLYTQTLREGEWFAQYRYSGAFFEDNLVGEQVVSDASAIGSAGAPAGILVSGVQTNEDAAPIAMERHFHTLNMMYGVSDEVSLYTLLPFASLSMDHVRGDSNPAGRGSTFKLENSGLADIQIGALVRILQTERHDLILNIGGSLPTGDVFEQSTIQSGGATFQPLSFPLRLGSGTFNLRPGITWRRYGKRWSTGAQAQIDMPLGRNYRGYSVSDEYRLGTWTSVLLKPNWAVSWRSEYLWRTDYDGMDNDLPNSVASTNVEAFQGGYWVTTAIGTQVKHGCNLFSAEIAPTVLQDVDGIQLEQDFQVFLNWARFF